MISLKINNFNHMKIFKFGGASVKNADAVRNLSGILNRYDENLVVVISAMGKTTDLLESLVKLFFNEDNQKWRIFDEFKFFHNAICEQLFVSGNIPESVMDIYEELKGKLRKEPSLDFNFEYDQVVSFGELISTRIVSEYLNATGKKNLWIDVRHCIRTDDNYRDASIDWELTEEFSKKTFT